MQTERVEQTLEIPVGGMDCAECASHVQDAVGAVAGVHSVEVRLAAERAVVRLDPTLASLADVRRAVERAGYTVPEERGADQEAPAISRGPSPILLVIGIVLAAGALVISEGVGVFDALQDRVPWHIGAALVVAGGFPIFRNVLRAALDRRITSHTLMTVGAAAALGTGEWVAAVLVVCFMRVGAYTERLTTERSRNALRSLAAAAPRTARVRRGSEEEEVQISQVGVGDVVIVRPGELIPVDGVVISGAATVQAAAITGESMPVEVGPGSRVHAATVAAMGALHVRTTAVGRDSMYGRVIRLVEEAEAHRADVQRVADKFSAWYLPVVGTIATLVFLLRRDPQATAAVLVVACSCSFALATPIAMLSSIGAGAKRGLLFKGGKYLETLARADVLLIDKTGTLTLGKPQITDVVALNGASEREVLALAASAERYSEHPLAEAVRAAARERGLAPAEPENFEATAGFGVRAQVGGVWAAVGSRRMVAPDLAAPFADELEAAGKTTLFVTRSGELIGVLAAADTPRPEARTALDAVRALGFKRIELLTGDNEHAASSLAEPLGVEYRANLLPEDKIGVVREYQAKGGVVVMVGDGVNDAPALAQADVGIAMGVGGTDAAFEAAHIALMRDDWMLAPEAIHLARRTMRVVKLNLAFTAAYNVVGLSLAAFGFLPPVVAAAAQSLPDVGILANSSRLLRYRARYDDGSINDDADRPAAAASGAEEQTQKIGRA